MRIARRHRSVSGLRTAAVLVLVAMSVAPVAATAAPTADSGAAIDQQQLQHYVTSSARVNRFPAVAVGVIDRAARTAFAGAGSSASGKPTSPDTPFLLGSVSKSLTGLAVMQLVEAGAINLDDPVVRYVPAFDLADHDAAAAITMRELLNHTSGLPPTACETESRDLDGFVTAIRKQHVDRKPGSRYEYCSGNYNLLGDAIQHVTGMSYAKYMRERVFVPLGMTQSTADEASADRSALVGGHTWMFGAAAPLHYYNPSGVPAGYISSTARDMTRFLRFELGAASGGRVLSPRFLAETQRGSVDAGSGGQYAMGWLVGTIRGVPAIYHYGTTFTYEAFAVIAPRSGRAAVVLVNAQGLLAVNAVRRLEAGVTALLAGKPPGGPGWWTVPHLYVAADLLMALLLFLAVRSVIAAMRPRERFAGSWMRGVGLTLLGALLIAGTRLFFGNLGARNWQEILRLLPDVVGWLLTLSALLVLAGVTRLVRAANNLPRTATPQ